MSGNLTRDPEIRLINERLTVGTIGLAVTTFMRGKNGEEKEETCFLDCTLWNEKALDAQKYLKKGSRVTVEGRLKLDTWPDKTTGMKREKHVLVVDSFVHMDNMAPARYEDSGSNQNMF